MPRPFGLNSRYETTRVDTSTLVSSVLITDNFVSFMIRPGLQFQLASGMYSEEKEV